MKNIIPKRGINIKWHMCRYTPESLRIWVNGKPIYLEEPSRLGLMVMCGKEKEAHDEIKRIIRKRRKQRLRVTIGFFKVNSRDYMYTRELGAYDDDLQDKLRIYKNFKEYCISRNCDLATHEITSGELTPFGMAKGSTVESHDIVDLNRPVKLKYRYKEEII